MSCWKTTFRGNRDKSENMFAGLHRRQVSTVSGKINERQHGGRGFGFFWKQRNEKQNLHFNLFTTFVWTRREDRVGGGQTRGPWKGELVEAIWKDLLAGRWGSSENSFWVVTVFMTRVQFWVERRKGTCVGEGKDQSYLKELPMDPERQQDLTTQI